MRTLPLRLSPINGESLPGYVARYSHTFQFPPGDVLRALGLDGGSGIVLAAGRYGAWLSPGQLEHVAVATGIDPATIERMLLSRFAGRAFQQPAGALDTALTAAAQAHEVLIRCSRFCPRCLHDHGAWLLSWQLGWSFACILHGVLLVRRCPSCGTVTKAALRDSWPSEHGGALSDPTRCAHRSSRVLCRAPFASASPATVGDVTLAAQRRINALLDGESDPTLAGVQLDPPVYLRDLLTLCNLLHRYARPPAQANRSRLLGHRLHDHPDELAAVLPKALALADLPDPDALTDALRELADRRYRADGLTLLASKAGPISEQFKAVLRRAVSRAVWASASRQLGFHPAAHRRPDDLDQRLQPRHVPQLFWAEEYERDLSELFDFDDFTHWLGRRFCSVLLARMLSPLDWDAAVRYLDFPERFINKGYNTTFTKLRSNDRFNELASRVKRIANRRRGRVDRLQAAPSASRGLGRGRHRQLASARTPTAANIAVAPRGQATAPRAILALAVVPSNQRPRARRANPAADHARALRPDRVHPRRAADPARSAADPRRATHCHARRGSLDPSQPPRRSTSPAWTPGRELLPRHDRPADHRPRSRARWPTPASTSPPSPPHRSDRTHHPPSRTPGCSLPGCCAAPRSLPSPRSALPSAVMATTSPTTTCATAARSLTTPAWSPNSTSWSAPSSGGACPRLRLRARRTTNACVRSPSPSKPTGPTCSIPPTGNTQRAAPASRSAVTTPISPATRLPTSTTSKDAQPSFSHATVVRHCRTEPDFAQRYQQLAEQARRLQRQAGYTRANLRRGLASGRAT